MVNEVGSVDKLPKVGVLKDYGINRQKSYIGPFHQHGVLRMILWDSLQDPRT